MSFSRHLRFSVFLLTGLLAACDSTVTQNQTKVDFPRVPPGQDSVLSPIQQPDVNEEDPDSTQAIYITSFHKAFQDFQTAVFNEDAEGVNQFIDPRIGLYIIENPGALPKMTLVKDIRDFKREFQDQSFFTIKHHLKTCTLKEEALPTFNCDGTTDGNTGYSKEGCFAADAAEFRRTEMHKYASLSETEIKHIEATLPLVSKTIVQTASSYRFHWGYINRTWKLLFIDLRIPCSA